jgi:hypothetical protein
MRRCKQLESTAEIGIAALGTGTLLIRPELSINEVVPVLHATEKKLKGTIPHKRNTGKFLIGDENIRILVKTNDNTNIMTRGFSTDHNTPSDMFRYRTRKSFKIRLFNKNL